MVEQDRIMTKESKMPDIISFQDLKEYCVRNKRELFKGVKSESSKKVYNRQYQILKKICPFKTFQEEYYQQLEAHAISVHESDFPGNKENLPKLKSSPDLWLEAINGATGISNESRNLMLYTLRLVYNFLIRNLKVGPKVIYMESNPANFIATWKRDNRNERLMVESDIKAIERVVRFDTDERLYFRTIKFMFYTGLKRTEVIKLKTIHCNKFNTHIDTSALTEKLISAEDLPVINKTIKALLKEIEEEAPISKREFVFVTPKGVPYNYNVFSRSIKSLLIRANLENVSIGKKRVLQSEIPTYSAKKTKENIEGMLMNLKLEEQQRILEKMLASVIKRKSKKGG